MPVRHTVQYGVVGGLAVAMCAAFLLGQPGDLPMDDAYIHCQYADNLAGGYGLVFNRGEFTGIGSTSILWVLLLAALKVIGVPTIVGAKALGMAAFVVSAWCVLDLGRSLFDRVLGVRGDFAPLVGACLFVLSGNMIWFALSGMETMLFLALGLLALTLYQSERFPAMCVCLALMTLTRTEGVVLAGIILALEFLRVLRRERGSVPASLGRLVAGCLLFAVIIAPWFLFLYHSTGHPLPTSFAGKKLHQMAGLDHFLLSRSYLAWMVHAKPLVFVGMWVGYLATFVFGGTSIPGPAIPVGRYVGLTDALQVSWGALIVVAGIIAPLLIRGLGAVRAWWRSAIRGTQADHAVLALLVWTVMHNLAYMIMFPSMGTTTRYQAINHLVVWLLVATGLFAVRRRKVLFCGAFCSVAAVAVLNACYWRGVYDANMDHMRNVRIASSQFLDRTLPPDAVVAAHDIGAIRYYCSRRLVDVGGLIDASFVDHEKRDTVDEYLLSHNVSYLVIPGKHSTEAEPLFDFIGLLGLWDSPKLKLRERWSFENDYDVWVQGNKPTGNYLPSVTIYEVVACAPSHPG